MSLKKKSQIKGMEPYNAIFYLDCFYNSFFPILELYAISPNHIIGNNISYYEYVGNSNNRIKLSLIEELPLADLVTNFGLKIKSFLKSETIVKDIIQELDKNNPVIVWLDCFHLSYREDTYLKKHIGHTILFNGYDDENRIFNVIEHTHEENLDYSHTSIPYKDVVNANNSYILDQTTGKNISMLSVERVDEFYDVGNKFFQNYLNRIKKNENKLLSGLKELESYNLYLKKVFNCQKELHFKTEQILIDFNNIINLKKAESKIFFDSLQAESVICLMISGVVTAWEKCRFIIGKYLLSQKIQQKSLLKICDNINQIINNEKKIYKLNCRILEEGLNPYLIRKKLNPVLESKIKQDIDLEIPLEVIDQIKEIWMDVLDKDHINNHDSFYDLGGHSLKLIQIILRINEFYGIEVQLSDVFKAQTIFKLAILVNNCIEHNHKVIFDEFGIDALLEEIEKNY
ncbi:MAG: hypothetical protein GY756_18835 [bacterium]|nr:hypothetical protein [bacterium]